MCFLLHCQTKKNNNYVLIVNNYTVNDTKTTGNTPNDRSLQRKALNCQGLTTNALRLRAKFLCLLGVYIQCCWHFCRYLRLFGLLWLLLTAEAQHSARSLVIWLAPWTGKMNRILRFDWLHEWVRWHNLASSELPAVSCKKIVSLFRIINPLLTELVRSRWFWPRSFSACFWTSTPSRSINTREKKQKENGLGKCPAILTSGLVNKPNI